MVVVGGGVCGCTSGCCHVCGFGLSDGVERGTYEKKSELGPNPARFDQGFDQSTFKVEEDRNGAAKVLSACAMCRLVI